MTSFNHCLHECCLATGHCCGCCGKAKLADPEVRAVYEKLQGTFRRMEAIEVRCAASIATLKEEQCHDQHQLEPVFETDLSRTAGANVLGAPAAPFNSQVADAIETLRTLRTWL